MIQDLRYALRQLLRSPGFTAVAVLTLALGIGLCTALFSVIDAVLLRPLPCPEPDRLVALHERSPQIENMSVSYPDFLDWYERQTCFSSLGLSRIQSFNYAAADATERVVASVVTHGYFTALGVVPLRGRLFTAADDEPGAERTAIVGEAFWRRRLGARESALGERIRLNGDSYTIVGILPDTFLSVSGEGDLALPIGPWRSGPELTQRRNHAGFYGIARLRPGMSFAAANERMGALAAQLAAEYPAENAGISVAMEALADVAFGSVRRPLWVLFGAAGLVLLIACVNTANLQLARAQSRQREFATRAALGASRARLIRQTLAESLVLGLGGCTTGILLGHWTVALLRTAFASSLPRLDQVELDVHALWFAVAISLSTSLVVGLVPAFTSARQDLRSAFAGIGGSIKGNRWRTALIVGEFALTSLLLVGAGLMLRTLGNLQRAHLGFSTEHVLTFCVALAGPAFQSPAQRQAYVADSLDRLQSLSGVRSAAVTDPIPLRNGNQSIFYVEGSPLPSPGASPLAERAAVTDDFFTTLGIGLVAGRAFGPQDNDASPRVAIVDTTFVAKHFPGSDPLGRRFAYGDCPPTADSDWLEIVGVVDHIQNFGLRSSTREQTYLPYAQRATGSLVFALSTAGDPAALIPAVRSAMRGASPDLAVFNIRTMAARFGATITTERLAVWLLGGFALLALFLAAIGLYGVLSYTVGRRTREIGIRMALGANAAAVVALVIRQGVRLAGLGLGIGLAAALGATRVLENLLYGVAPVDPLSFAAVALVLAGVGAFACWLPARRASHLDPIVALRDE